MKPKSTRVRVLWCVLLAALAGSGTLQAYDVSKEACAGYAEADAVYVTALAAARAAHNNAAQQAVAGYQAARNTAAPAARAAREAAKKAARAARNAAARQADAAYEAAYDAAKHQADAAYEAVYDAAISHAVAARNAAARQADADYEAATAAPHVRLVYEAAVRQADADYEAAKQAAYKVLATAYLANYDSASAGTEVIGASDDMYVVNLHRQDCRSNHGR